MPTQQLQHMLGGLVFPSDTNEIWQDYELEYQQTSTLYIGEAGNVRVKTASGNIVTFKNLKAGQFVPVHVLQVFKTGTTAGKIIALDMKPLILPVILDGLVMWHEFSAIPWDGSTNRLPDSSGTGNSAKMYTGTGLSFDGSNDSVVIGDTMNIVRSVVFYASADSTTTKFMQLRASGAVDIGVSGGTITTTGWTSASVYVNGVAGNTITANSWRQIAVTSDTQVLADNVILGLSNATYYSGDLSNVKFFSVKLTASQVAELYANPEQIVPTGVGLGDLVGWWYMAEGSTSTIVLDASGNNNGGLISGATTVNALVSPVTQLGLLGGSAPMYYVAGVDQRISIGTLTNNGSNYSAYVEFIHEYTSANPTLSTGFCSFGQLYMYRVAATYFTVITNGSTPTGNAFNFSYNFEAGKKYAVWYTQDGTTGKLYVNGSLASTLTVTLGPGTALPSSIYGFGSNNGLKQGMITEVAFYEKTVSSTEIEDIYNKDIDFVDISDLYGYWRNTGKTDADWVDLSNNGRDGTVNGTPGTIWLPQGKEIGKDVVGMAQKYVNTGQLVLGLGTESLHLIVPYDASIDLVDVFSLEAWLKIFKIGNAMYVYIMPNSYAFFIDNLGNITPRMRVGGTSYNRTAYGPINIDTWYHVAITYNSAGDMKTYINGNIEDTVSSYGTLDSSTGDLLISSFVTTVNFEGSIDSAKIYNTELTADQVLQNYNAEKYKYI